MNRIVPFTARMMQVMLDIVAAVLGIYYSRKYAAIARRLGLPRVTSPNKRRGFVIIQVDGLAHSHLTAAMDLGYAPTMQRLLRWGEFALRHWQPGLPCTTPASQAGIMFGSNEDIPAYRWYDKATGESIVCSVPRDIQAIQERISRGRKGILAGGSSFMNMFDGDASLCMFTLGAWNRKRFFESVQGVGFLFLFLLNPYRTLKTMVLALWEYLTDLTQRTRALIKHEMPRPLDRAFPFLRVMGNVVFREIQTFAVMVDVYRGVPAIYTTYYGYDELAHNYGPLSKQALRALHAIDARVRQIDALRRLALTREYDLYLLSDHGQTAASPFSQIYGQTLGELARDLVGGEVYVNETHGAERQGDPQVLFLKEELATIEANVGPRLAYIPRKIRELVSERLSLNGPPGSTDQADPSAWDLPRRTDLVVRNSGSLSHIYFNVSPRRLDLSEIATLYPRFINDLAAHAGIWLVIGREGEQVVVMSKDGVLSLESGYHVEGNDPLARLPAPWLAAEQLQRLACFPHAGDLILMGDYVADLGTVVCFEEHWGCHGGLGGPQETAFMILDSAIGWDLNSVTQATQIYSLFVQRYQT